MASTQKRKRPAKLDTPTLVDILKKRMSPVIVCLSNSWGGLEKIAATDTRDLAKAGLKPILLCLDDSPIHTDLAEEDNIDLRPIGFRPRDHFDFKLKKLVEDFVSKDQANLFHIHQPSLLGSFSPWLWNKRDLVLVASRHIMNSHNKTNLFHSLIYRRLDTMIVMSEALKKNVQETHNLKERQLKVIRYGLDFHRFDPEKVKPQAQRESWGADKDTIVMGLVGRIDPHKGQDTFIKAAAGLIRQMPKRKKIKFVIVGEETRGRNRNWLAELRSMVRQFQIDDYMIFAGYHDDIPEVMGALDIFVMPSRQEAFGLVAIEAMAMECPIVISSGGSAAEIVGNEEFGVLVRPQDAYDLRRQMKYLLENPKKRNEMGKNARKHVKKNYDRKDRFRETLEVYERCFRRRS